MERTRRKRFVVTRKNLATHELIHQDVLLVPTINGKCHPADFRKFNTSELHVVSVLPKGEFKKLQKSCSWLVDEQMLSLVCDQMNVRFPVNIKKTAHIGDQQAAHRLMAAKRAPKGVVLPEGTDTFHHITIKSYLSVSEAGEALHHELAHAMQSERAMRKYYYNHPAATHEDMRSAWYSNQQRSKAFTYETRPIEVEARLYEKNNDEFPLTLAL